MPGDWALGEITITQGQKQKDPFHKGVATPDLPR